MEPLRKSSWPCAILLVIAHQAVRSNWLRTHEYLTILDRDYHTARDTWDHTLQHWPGSEFFPLGSAGALVVLLGGALWMAGHRLGWIRKGAPGWWPLLAALGLAIAIVRFVWQLFRQQAIATSNNVQAVDWAAPPLVALGCLLLLLIFGFRYWKSATT